MLSLRISLLFLFFLPLSLVGQGDPEFILIESGFTEPVDIKNANDGSNRLFIVEREGIIKMYDLDTKTTNNNIFLDISSIVESTYVEEGLLGLTFDPNFSSNGYFYVYYIRPENAGGSQPDSSRVSRFNLLPGSNLADPNSEFPILQFSQPYGNHNGGDIHFGPDGFLYIATGDGGSAGDPDNNGQDMTNLLGTILRIDVSNDQFPLDPINNYAIPPNNPFVGVLGAREEIWHYGLRNPWRFSFDSQNGDMYIADVGQSDIEEVDYAIAGSSGLNFGWKCMEGDNQFSFSAYCNNGISSGLFEGPVFSYTHSQGFSITGGYVYRGNAFNNFKGWYFCQDYVTDRLWMITKDAANNWTDVNQGNNNGVNTLSAFGVSEGGEMYAVSFDDGNLYRLIDRDVCPDNITLTTPGAITYKAVQTISSSVMVPTNSFLNYSAGDCITLQAGFEVPATTVFNAIIEICGAN